MVPCFPFAGSQYFAIKLSLMVIAFVFAKVSFVNFDFVSTFETLDNVLALTFTCGNERLLPFSMGTPSIGIPYFIGPAASCEYCPFERIVP